MRFSSQLRLRPALTGLTVAVGLGAASGSSARPAQISSPQSERRGPSLQQGCVDAGRPFREAIRAVHEQQENVGYAAAVMLDGALVQSVAEGLADLEHGVPVTPQSRFGTASVTKAITGSALLKLHEAGRVDLDMPVHRLVPEYPVRDDAEITIRQLLTHTSGIPHPSSRPPSLYATHYDDVIDAIEIYRETPLLFAPGSSFRYSSSNYNLLAAVIQRIADRRFQDFVTDEILHPLDMSLTEFDDVRWVMPNRTRRYAYFDPWSYRSAERLHRIPGRWDYSFNMGGGNIISTAEDLVKLGHAFTEPGFFTAESLESVYSPIPTGDVETPWSFGWFATTDDAGRRRLHMNGANPGLQAELTVYPDHDLVVAVLANSWGHGARSTEMVDTARFAARCMGWPDPD